MSGLSIIVLLASLIVAEGSVETAPSSGLACSALQRIQLTEETALIDGVPLGANLSHLGSVHRRDLDLRLHWGPSMGGPCGRITGSVPGDPHGLAFSNLPGEDPLKIGGFYFHFERSIDVKATLAALRTQLPTLRFFSTGAPWTEELDESPIYVPASRAYFIGISEERLGIGLARCFPGGLQRTSD